VPSTFSNQQLRTAPGVVALIWGLLVLGAIAGTARQFAWHVEFFRLAGEPHYRLLLIALPAMFAGPLGYHWLRARGITRWEPLLLGVLVLLPPLVYEPRALLAIVAVAASAHVIGGAVLRICRVEAHSLSTLISMTIAAGTGVLQLGLFALGMAGWYRVEVFLLLVLPGAFGWRRLLASAAAIREAARNWTGRFGPSHPVLSVAVFFLAVFMVLTALSAITPATNGDAIRSHLSLAKSYLQAGSLSAPPFNQDAYYPQGYEILLTMLWGLGGQPAAQMLNPLQFAMTLLLVYGIGRLLGMPAAAALLGVVLGAMSPFLHWTGSVVKNDLGLTLYLLAALSCVLHWGRERSAGWIHLSVFFLACGFGVKHTALFGAVPLGLLILRALWSHPRRWKVAPGMALLFMLTAGGWHARAWWLQGHPLYPAQASSAITTTTHRTGLLSRTWRILKLPWSVHVTGRRHFESPTENPMGVSLLLFAPLLLLVRSRAGRAPLLNCWFFIAVYLTYWGAVLGMMRYAIAPLLLLFLLVGERLEAVSRSAGRIPRVTAPGALLYAAVFATLVTVILEMYPRQPALLAGRIDRRQFLSAELTPFSAIDFLNGRAGRGDLVLSVGNWAVSYAPYPADVNHVYRNERYYFTNDLAELALRPYRFLILPASENLAELVQAARAIRAVELLHADSHFRVYRVK